MEEPEIVPVQPIIPYFYFRNIPNLDAIFLYIHISSEFSEVKFSLQNDHVCVSTSVFNNQQYKARIKLPEKVYSVSAQELPKISTIRVNDSYMLYFKNISCKSNYFGMLDPDVISCHLSWGDQTIRELPDTLIQKPVDELECFKALKLSDPEERRVGFYGFDCRYTEKMITFEENWSSALELPDPEHSDPASRRSLRCETERQSFDMEHYLADYFFERSPDDDYDDDLSIQSTILYEPYWHSLGEAIEKVLKSDDMLLLAGLPSKDFKLNPEERLEVLHSLLDIILAYAYDNRLTRGVHNSESAWNIAKLSATLSWFQVHRHVGDAVESFMRRSLTYPANRNWLLSTAVYKDALEIFNLGRRQILNCLVHIHEIFEADDDRKFLNELYIEDYLIWIQQVHPKTIRNYLKYIESCQIITKENVFPILPMIEEEAINLFKNEEVENYAKWNKEFHKLSTHIENRFVNQGMTMTPKSLEISSSSSDDSLSDSSTDSDSEVSDSDSDEDPTVEPPRICTESDFKVCDSSSDGDLTVEPPRICS